SLTLSIAGIFKEVFTLYLAVNYNGDQMSRINFIGLIVCLLGIALHVVIKALDTTGKSNTMLWKEKSQSLEELNPKDYWRASMKTSYLI
ncbi:unnamed protein product, partial [Oppiella nova]